MTRLTLAVDDVWKGDSGEALTLYLLGGMDAGGPVPIEVVVPGTPRMAAGEAALLFLDAIPAGTGPEGYVIHGLIHGYAPLAPAPSGTIREVVTTSGRRPVGEVKARVSDILAFNHGDPAKRLGQR